MKEGKPTTYPENLHYELDELNSKYKKGDQKDNEDFSRGFREILERYGIMTSVDNVRFDVGGMMMRRRQAEREKQNEAK